MTRVISEVLEEEYSSVQPRCEFKFNINYTVKMFFTKDGTLNTNNPKMLLSVICLKEDSCRFVIFWGKHFFRLGCYIWLTL